MKNIFLIGDSIRYGNFVNSPGYGVYVKKKLEGKANIYSPDDNCRFVEYTLRYLHEWAMDIDREKIDVVHWNNGLWDVVRLFGDEPLTPLDVYGNTLKRIYKRIKYLFPKAKIIFALSTAVIEDPDSKDFVRLNRDIEEYNNKAKEVMASLGVEVNDLYGISAQFDPSLHSDGTHFGDKGSELLADAVIKACFED